MNIFKRFERLMRYPALRIATVTAAHGTGWFLEELDGAQTTAVGEASVGQKVYVRENQIVGPAPDLVVQFMEE